MSNSVILFLSLKHFLWHTYMCLSVCKCPFAQVWMQFWSQIVSTMFEWDKVFHRMEACQVTYVGIPESCRICPRPLPQCQDYSMYHNSQVFMQIPNIEHRSSCLQGKYFINDTFSPGLYSYFVYVLVSF